MLIDRYGINNDTVSIIGEFSILWCRFEQVYFSMHVTSAKLIDLANQIQNDDELSSLYDSLKSTSVKYLQNTDAPIIMNRIFSERNPGKEQDREQIYEFLNGDSSNPNWPGCMLYIQRIRNNLFHGLKDIYSLDKQKEMFTSICKLLNYILDSDNF